MASPNFPYFTVIPELGDEAFFEEEEEMMPSNPTPTEPENAPVDNASVHNEEAGDRSRGKRPRTSPAWQHFTEEPRPNPKTGEMENRAVCKYCKKHFSNKKGGGTGHLDRHWKACLPLHQGGSVDSRQQTLSLTSHGLQNFTYDAQRAREALAKFLASAELPLSFADDASFEEFIQIAFCPQFKRVSRNTTRSDCMKVFYAMRQSLVDNFRTFNATVSCTSDLWEGCNKTGYLCVTAHYVDDDWVLQKRIIGFRLCPYPHNATAIFNTIMEIFGFYGIEDKVLTITFDNASANTAAINLFKRSLKPAFGGEIFHQRCACHIINLVVQAGIEHISINLTNIREALSFISSSGARLQEFKQYCRNSQMRPRKFPTDVRHRWNSTYLMLKAALPYSQLITTYVNSKNDQILIFDSDWQIAEYFFKFLEVFYNATELLSGVYYPTAHLALHQLFNISETFSYYRDTELFKNIVNLMENKFKNYWSGCPMLYALATILDPRCGVDGTESLMTATAENLNIDMQLSITDAKKMLEKVFSLYEVKYSTGQKEQGTSSSTTSSGPKGSSWSFLKKKEKTAGSSSTQASTELVKYFEANFVIDDDKLDILQWWKSKTDRFPTLSIIARDILTTPVSTVASEQAFSASNRILDEKRSRMHPDILEGLMCVKDWEDARRRKQQYTDDSMQEYFSNLEITESSGST